jgi:hypothetical protein
MSLWLQWFLPHKEDIVPKYGTIGIAAEASFAKFFLRLRNY